MKYKKTRGVCFSLSKTEGFVVFVCWVFGGVAAAGGPSLQFIFVWTLSSPFSTERKTSFFFPLPLGKELL